MVCREATGRLVFVLVAGLLHVALAYQGTDLMQSPEGKRKTGRGQTNDWMIITPSIRRKRNFSALCASLCLRNYHDDEDNDDDKEKIRKVKK